MELIKSHKPLKAENFLQLVTEGGVWEIESTRRAQYCTAGFEDEGDNSQGMQVAVRS